MLGGSERRAQSLAKRGGGSCQMQRLLGVRLSSGAYGKTFKHPRDAAFVTQFLEHLDALAVETTRLGVVPLIAAETCQVGESACDSPVVPQSAKRCQALFAIGTRGIQIRFFPGDVAQIIQRPGDTGAIPDLTEHGQALVVQRGCARIFALQLHHAGEIAEGSGDIGGIAKVLPDRDTSLEE